MDIGATMAINFKKDNYYIIKEALSKEISNFVYNYFLIKRQVAFTFRSEKYISPLSEDWGTWEDEQVPNTYSHYADIAMETLLLFLHPIMEKKTGLKLIPNYSYARIYKDGDILEKHIDRFSCEISTTLNLGGDTWPIFLKTLDKKEIKVSLEKGDMLVYRGNILEHWRERFAGKDCAQVFLHYNNAETKGSADNIYDTRPHIGLPLEFKRRP